MKKVYLAGGISDTARKEYQKYLAERLRKKGDYKVYAAAENDSINDKRNNPTPLDIYNGDIEMLKDSDIFVQTISGGNEDGTNYESGVVAGINESRRDYNFIVDKIILAVRDMKYNKTDNQDVVELILETLEDYRRDPIEVVAFTINERLLNPQFSKGAREDIIGIPSGGYNHLILGGIDKWGKFVGVEDDVLKEMEEKIND